MLIDELYDRGVKIVVSAAAPPDALYRGERLQLDFRRAASRLVEMQTHRYLGGRAPCLKRRRASPGIIRGCATVAEFKIEYKQILDPRGEIVAPLPEFAADPDEVLRMYRAMTRVRVFDAKAVNLQRTGQLGTYPSSLGHEAAHIGVGAAMRPEDVLAPVYREFGTQLWRGVTMKEILLYWGGDERGNDFAGPRHDFAWCVPIATQTLHAAGAAMAFKMRKEPRCALAYIGDGGTSEGAFYEALNLAGARALPVVFVIVNNGWAISVPVAAADRGANPGAKGRGGRNSRRAGRRQRCVRGARYGRRGARRGAARRAVRCLIEALTYRLSDHTTADDASRYRSAEEVKEAWALEPLIRMRALSAGRGRLVRGATSRACSRNARARSMPRSTNT